MKFVAILQVIALAIYANGLCNFPCDFIGKRFFAEDITYPNITAFFVFDAQNRSAFTIEIQSNVIHGTCHKIIGNQLVFRLNFNGRILFQCVTFRIDSPDVFSIYGRNLSASEELCEMCYPTNLDPGPGGGVVLRANGDDAEVCEFTCLGPRECVTCDEQACDNLPPIEECYRQFPIQKPNYYVNHRYQKRRNQHYRKGRRMGMARYID